jgi:hypothetical protein
MQMRLLIVIQNERSIAQEFSTGGVSFVSVRCEIFGYPLIVTHKSLKVGYFYELFECPVLC